jgi:hypothetical protein
MFGSGQSEPTEGNGDQPQHQGDSATDYSVAGTEITFGAGQIQPALTAAISPTTRATIEESAQILAILPSSALVPGS